MQNTHPIMNQQTTRTNLHECSTSIWWKAAPVKWIPKSKTRYGMINVNNLLFKAVVYARWKFKWITGCSTRKAFDSAGTDKGQLAHCPAERDNNIIAKAGEISISYMITILSSYNQQCDQLAKGVKQWSEEIYVVDSRVRWGSPRRFQYM